ncbi:type 4b pilus protein PilO2 [Enterobacter hormaechei]|uniref:type 4b pilus protein PilO2 n=1 Tax=Enterobacter hormaechei TaxID=158836 RepID=UPI003C6BF7B8
MPDSSLQLIPILSWFQRQQITLNIIDVAMPPVLPGSNGEPPPVQDWQEYAFSFSAPLPAIILFDGLDETGIRLTRLTFELNGSAFSYTTEGKIYASAK